MDQPLKLHLGLPKNPHRRLHHFFEFAEMWPPIMKRRLEGKFSNGCFLKWWVFPPNHPFLVGFSIIFTIHFGVPLFLETPKYTWKYHVCQHPPQKKEVTSGGICLRKWIWANWDWWFSTLARLPCNWKIYILSHHVASLGIGHGTFGKV